MRMAPEWIIQTIFLFASILGSGAVFYFLSQMQYHAALWSWFTTVVLILAGVAVYIHNDMLRRGIGAPAQPSSAGVKKVAP